MSKPPSRSGWAIEPVGSAHAGWALAYNGQIQASHPSAYVLGAYLDARLKGADTRDAWIIAKAMAKRGWPTMEERLAVFEPDGGPPPSLQPFRRGQASKGASMVKICLPATFKNVDALELVTLMSARGHGPVNWGPDDKGIWVEVPEEQRLVWEEAIALFFEVD